MGLLERHSMPLFNVPYRITVSFSDDPHPLHLNETTMVGARDSDDAAAYVDRIWEEGDSLFPDDFVSNILYEKAITATDLDIGTPELVETHGN